MFDYADNRYKAEVIRWLDGDTVELRVDLGQRVQRQDKFRLARIDAPETALRSGVTPEEKQAGLALKESLSLQYPSGTEVAIATTKAGKYGRYLVEIWVKGEVQWHNLNDILLRDGLVDPY